MIVIPHEEFALTHDGVHLQRDNASVLRNHDKLDEAIIALTFYFDQARMRGDDIIMEIWSPNPIRRETAYTKSVFREGG